MKVISVRKNKATFDFTKKEEHALFKHGLQIWVDKEVGVNKLKVVDIDDYPKSKKPETRVEIDDKFSQECIELAVNDALKIYLDKNEK